MVRRMSSAVGAAALACAAAGGALGGIVACVGDTPSDCVSHFNCTATGEAGADGGPDVAAGSDAGLDATVGAGGDQSVPPVGEAGDAAALDEREGRADHEDAGQVQDAPLDTWDGFDGFTCDPTKSPHDAPCVIDEAFGVFVAPTANGGSDVSGDGSKAKPYATIGHALGGLGRKARVYVCAGSFAEQITLSTAVSLYGGLACPGGDAGSAWSYVGGGVARVTGPQSQIALVVTGVSSAIAIEDMGFSAPNAMGQDTNGNGLSSIAVLLNASTVTLRRCVLAAGSGDNGKDAPSGSNYSGMVAPNGSANNSGVGGAGGIAVCTYGASTGAAGGSVNAVLPEGDGGAGTATPPATPSGNRNGAGGKGEDTLGVCSKGNNGADGLPRMAGGPAAGYGTLLPAGWTPSAGSAGAASNPGQGGGGGGASAVPPQGGTGGGAGGCGGAGGSGGPGGGASIALACIASNVTLDQCTFTTSNGGNGGKGAAGQPGQGGGTYGSAVGPCLGGYGGNGAGGSAGGGGTGGISACVAYKGSAPAGTPTCTLGGAGLPGNGGMGGDGGTNPLGSGPSGAVGGQGLAGAAAASLQLQ
jgi:hypothetical protein